MGQGIISKHKEIMMKFTAQKIDLTLELTVLDGSEVTLDTKVTMTSEEILNTMEVWKSIEKEFKDNNVRILAEQLTNMYPKSSTWFLQNFDVKTLNEIIIYVASSMGGIRKNEESSS